jgi:triosephosphate isomerase
MSLSASSIGYEPLWAIGTGRSAASQEIVEMHAHIRRCLIARFGAEGKKIRILYGGSVNPANASEILSLPEVGGVLVGGESLKAHDFEAIIKMAPAEV